jgi:hypothetical protein
MFGLISLNDSTKGDFNISIFSNSATFYYPCSISDDCAFYNVLLPKNRYLIEVWGGEGGYLGGKGGYSGGILSLKENTKISIFIGAKGNKLENQSGIVQSAYNGGGQSYSASTTRSSGSGGGGTDIRIGGSTIFHRILVAGGGGGGNTVHETSTHYYGGAGGGIQGLAGTKTYVNKEVPGGQQDSGGQGEEAYGGSSSRVTHSGIFGYGGYGTSAGTNSGGGGGWYGGAGSAPSYHGGGGGGSGYVLNSTSFKPYEYQHNSSISYFFESSLTHDGSQSFPSCYSSNLEQEEGHLGHGCARITILSFCTIIYKHFYLNSHRYIFVIFIKIFLIY